MAIESSHRLIRGKWLNCIYSITSEALVTIFGNYDHLMIVYPVYVFYDQWPFCLVAMATLNSKKKKEGIFKRQLLQNHWSSMTDLYNCCLGKSLNYGDLLLGLIAMATESSHRLIMWKWLKCIFSITSEVIWTMFSSYDQMIIVYSVFVR